MVQFRVYFVNEINQLLLFHIGYQLERGCNLWVRKFISSGTINSKNIFRSENSLCPLQAANCSFWFSPGSFERIFFSLIGNNDAIRENFLDIEENKHISKQKLFPRGKMYKAKNEGNHIYEVSVKEMDFELSFKKKSNCEKGLLTDTPGYIKINVKDFVYSECIFSVHAQYGYRIKLTLDMPSGFCNFFHLEITDRERVRRVCTSLEMESIGNLMHWHINKIFHGKSYPDDLLLSVNYTFIYDFPIVNKCRQGSFYLNGFCFELFLKRLNWTEAEMFCDQMDGNLATLKDEETSQSIYDIVRFSPHYKSKSGFWIGASSHREGEYSWTSHEPFSYTNWFSGKTNLTEGFEVEEESCVEIRQRILALKGVFRNKRLAGRKTGTFYWLKRDCSKKNMFICETKPLLGDEMPKVNCSRFYILNGTLLLNFTLEDSYCNITVSVPPESKAIIDFKAFSIRDSEGCQSSRFEIKAPFLEEAIVFCGDLSHRLKHLKRTFNSGNIEFYFISPRKSHRQIIQLVVRLEKEQNPCPNRRYLILNGFCVLPVSYPRVTWNTAHEICKGIQAQLISSSILDGLPVSELTREYGLDSFWIQDNLHLDGGLEILPEFELNDAIDQGNIEGRYEQSNCPILEVTIDKPKKRHIPCDSVAGYICQRNTEFTARRIFKTLIEAEKGRITSPNFPDNYPANLHHEVEITGLSDSRLLVTFTSFDVEPSDNCTFDYLELQGEKKKGIYACGSYEGQLQRLDFLSSSNRIRIIFSTDDSVEGKGFELNWRTFPSTSESEILHVVEEPQVLMSNNYPYFMLPGVIEQYILESSNDSWIMLEFRDLEIITTDCATYLEIEVDNLDRFKICSSEAKFRRSYASAENKLVVRLVTDSLRGGRGFKATYRSVPFNMSPTFNIFLDKGLNLILPVNYKSRPLIPSYNQKLIAPVKHFLRLQVSRYEDLRLLKDPYSLGIGYVEESKLNVAYIERDVNYDGIVSIIVDEDPAWNSKLEPLFNGTLESCSPNPCNNNGDCFSDDTGHHCHCKGVWKGPFCTINDCYSSPCDRGFCVTNSTTWWCECEEGFKGKNCSVPKEPCDYNPCGGNGLCSNFGEDFRCKCYPQWQGSRCETRLFQIPYKPLSDRMLEEPFWLGLLTVFTVLVLIGIAYCGKRHLKEKFEKFITEELERNGIQDFNCHANASRRNSLQYTSLDPMLAQHISPGRDSSPIPFVGRRSFLDRFGVRKFSTHSLLSVPDSTMHRQIATPENSRTLSLDDILKLSRKSRSPSPGRVSNCKIQQYKTPSLEPISIDVTYAQVEINPGPVEELPEASLDARHEKRVTFARLLKKVQTELSSSLSDLSTHERRKVQERELHEKQPKPFTKRRGRWARARLPNSTSSTQGSASDIDIPDTPEISSSENVTPITQTPLRAKLLRLPARTNSGSLKSGTNSSAESLMSMFKSAVGSRTTPSTPSSPQISEADLSSCFPTPLSTPGSPSDSCLSFSDQSLYSMSLESSNRRPNPSQQATTSLEIPCSSYCTLSPIRELPTPLPSPTPSPQPTPNLIRQTAIADKNTEGETSSTCSSLRSRDSNSSSSEGLKKPPPQKLTIILTDCDDKMEMELNVPVISVTECDSNPFSPSTLSSPVSRPSSPKTKPPPIEIRDSNFTRFINTSNEPPSNGSKDVNQRKCSLSQEAKIPVLQIIAPSPVEEILPVLPRKKQDEFSWKTVHIGSPPVRKIPILTIESEIETGLPKKYLRDLQEKSNSLDFPFVPPIITITSSFSEIESDTESPDQTGSKTTMCYLSPFSYLERRPEMTSSESNLSSSGYSSMASPGPSPSTSSKTLCGADDMPLKAHRIRSMTPSFDSTSPPIDSPLDQKNKKRHFFRSDSEFTDQEAPQAEVAEEHESTLESNDDDRVDRIRERIDEGELKSAKDLKDYIANIDLLPKPIVPKSQSLDSKNTIQRMSNLKSDSLDTKLMFNKLSHDSFLSLKPPTIVVQTLLTDDKEEERKLSPVSSRSESPLSDSKSFRFSSIYLGLSRRDLPFTDSDALYDYPSSEAIQRDFPEVAPQRHPKKIEKKRERRTSVQADGSLALATSLKKGKERSGKRRQQVFRAGTSSSSESLGQSVTLQDQSSSLPQGIPESTRFLPLRQPARRRQSATLQPASRQKSIFRRRFKRVQSNDGTLASADESDEL